MFGFILKIKKIVRQIYNFYFLSCLAVYEKVEKNKIKLLMNTVSQNFFHVDLKKNIITFSEIFSLAFFLHIFSWHDIQI